MIILVHCAFTYPTTFDFKNVFINAEININKHKSSGININKEE